MFKLLVLAAIAVALFLTNPSMDDFQQFARQHATDEIGRQTEGLPGGLGGLVGDLGGALAGRVAGQAADRDSYGLCSLYTLDLNGRATDGGEWKFLGIGTQFIELDRPDALEGER
jgi:hypothetical protein